LNIEICYSIMVSSHIMFTFKSATELITKTYKLYLNDTSNTGFNLKGPFEIWEKIFMKSYQTVEWQLNHNIGPIS